MHILTYLKIRGTGPLCDFLDGWLIKWLNGNWITYWAMVVDETVQWMVDMMECLMGLGNGTLENHYILWTVHFLYTRRGIRLPRISLQLTRISMQYATHSCL
jgi:hypothetical protein